MEQATAPVAPELRPAPVTLQDRIVSLDVLRGVAILGILLMNIRMFAMPSEAYFNPMAYGDIEGVNRIVWFLTSIFADGKFLAIFSMLFGAGIVLMGIRMEMSGRKPGRIHYRRMFWLLVIGIVHAYFIWPGDILVMYALTAMIIYRLWRRSARTLFIIAMCVAVFHTLLYLFFSWSIQFWPAEATAQINKGWAPTPEQVATVLEAYRGGYTDSLGNRVEEALYMHTGGYAFWAFWRISALMLFGMALMKWEVLSAQRSRRFYGWMVGAGLPVGLAIIAVGLHQNFAHEWDIAYSFFAGMQFNLWGALFVAAAYIGIVMLIVKSDRFAGFKRVMARVGRMAFTNYLLQSVICTLLFYGYGLGWYGSASHGQQMIVVVCVWAVLILFSVFWLGRYRFGPVEWLWRSLTYWKVPRMRD